MFPSSRPWPVGHTLHALARRARGRAGRLMARMIPRLGRTMVALAVEALVTGTALAHAQAPVTASGLPQQVIATFPEVGAPTFTTSPGTPSTWRHRWPGSRRCGREWHWQHGRVERCSQHDAGPALGQRGDQQCAGTGREPVSVGGNLRGGERVPECRGQRFQQCDWSLSNDAGYL